MMKGRRRRRPAPRGVPEDNDHSFRYGEGCDADAYGGDKGGLPTAAVYRSATPCCGGGDLDSSTAKTRRNGGGDAEKPSSMPPLGTTAGTEVDEKVVAEVETVAAPGNLSDPERDSGVAAALSGAPQNQNNTDGESEQKWKGEEAKKEDSDAAVHQNEEQEEEDGEDRDRRHRLFSLLHPSMLRRSDSGSSADELGFAPRHEALERATLTDAERAEAHLDLYGIAPPGSSHLRLESAAAVLDDALDCIPPEERGALSRARAAFPFLFVSCGAQSSSHVRVFLEAEEYDVSRAARRMVRYWSERERRLGEAAFASDAFTAPADEDIVRMIQRRMARSLDKKTPGAPEGESVFDDVHVLTVIQDFQNRRLRGLDAALAGLPPSAREAWEDARSSRPDLADTDAHKVIFLHCCDYDPKAAARRLANYWDMKYFLFGRDRAFGPITAADVLDDEEGGCREELEKGVLHLLPGTDDYGRGVLCFRADKMLRLENLGEDRIRVLRAAWYMLHSAQHSERIWLNGIVVINVTDHSAVNNFNYHFFLRMKTIMTDCVPMKCKAIHDCVLFGEGRSFTKMWLGTIVSVIKLVLGRVGRQRYWLHVVGSSPEELENELRNFDACGILKEQLPEALGGSLDGEAYARGFLEERRRIEAANTAAAQQERGQGQEVAEAPAAA